MPIQVFDDGSTLETDENGNIVAATEATDPYMFGGDKEDAARVGVFVPGAPGARAAPWWDRVLYSSIPRAIDSWVNNRVERLSDRAGGNYAGANGRTRPAGVQRLKIDPRSPLVWLILGGVLLWFASQR